MASTTTAPQLRRGQWARGPIAPIRPSIGWIAARAPRTTRARREGAAGAAARHRERCTDPDETFRIRYVAAHLAALDRARQRGADVRGYFHWTAVDNYEWNFGFGPERFGLIGFDAQTQQRSVKDSGRWMAELIDGVLDPAKIP
jgi:hypothetical protein